MESLRVAVSPAAAAPANPMPTAALLPEITQRRAKRAPTAALLSEITQSQEKRTPVKQRSVQIETEQAPKPNQTDHSTDSTWKRRFWVAAATATSVLIFVPPFWRAALLSIASAALLGRGGAAEGLFAPRKTALMELAGGIHGDAPEALRAETARVAARRAAASPPRSMDAELALLDETPTPRFEPDDPALLQHLDVHGFAVVAAVAPPDTLARAHDALWAFLEAHTGWRRADEATWTDAEYERVGSIHNGILNGEGIGNSELAWGVRVLPRVRATFARVWRVEPSALISSFDGANVFRPFQRGIGERTVGGWWHVDQGGARRGRHAVQGLVALSPQSAASGGLCVVPGSHKWHGSLCEDQIDPTTDYVTVQPYWEGFAALPARRRVVCEAGDLILWDSRTVHCNAPATRPECPDGALLRAACYVCQVPRAKASAAVLQARREGYRAGATTSHWPQKFEPGSVSDAPPQPEPADPIIRALVGW